MVDLLSVHQSWLFLYFEESFFEYQPALLSIFVLQRNTQWGLEKTAEAETVSPEGHIYDSTIHFAHFSQDLKILSGGIGTSCKLCCYS